MKHLMNRQDICGDRPFPGAEPGQDALHDPCRIPEQDALHDPCRLPEQDALHDPCRLPGQDALHDPCRIPEQAALRSPYRFPKPVRCLGRDGRPAVLAADLHLPHVTAFVGGGGKTSTIMGLAAALAAEGKKVIVTTTTHICPVAEPLPEGIRVMGKLLAEERLGPVDDLDVLIPECDYLLVEADGSRGLPAKAPAGHEPVIPACAELVVGIMGLSAPGHPIAEICHRPQVVCSLLGKSFSDTLTAEDAAFLLSHTQGTKKCVENRRYAVILNQADTPERIELGRTVLDLLPPDIPGWITCYDISRCSP